MDINLQAVLIGFHCVDNPKQKIPKPLLFIFPAKMYLQLMV